MEEEIEVEEEKEEELAELPGKDFYSYISKAWTNLDESYVKQLQWERLMKWRKEENFKKLEHPTRLDRARKLGYKAKQGYIMVRGYVRKGSFRKRQIKGGRRPKRKGINKITTAKNSQTIVEGRAAKRYPNLEVLNSYWVGEDGKRKWYEIIMVDPHHPVIKSDPKINWICDSHHKGRVHRGLTSSGKKARGLRKKGKGAEKVRSSKYKNKKKS